jgi:hypothetical protein
MLKLSKGLIAFLLLSCLLITAVPVFAAETAVTPVVTTVAAEEAAPVKLDGFAYLTVDFDGLEEVPFTSNNIDNLAFENGILHGTSNGSDPFINYTPGVNFAADSVDYIMIKIDADSASTALQFFFTTDTISWSEAASFKYDFKADKADADGFITVKLDTSTCAEWKGIITGIRLDPFSDVGDFALESIVFWSTATTVAKIDFAKYEKAPFDASGDVAQLFTENGYLYGSSKGGDPYLNFNGGFSAAAANIGAIHFRMKSFSANPSFQLFFTTETIGWSEAASFKVDLSKLPKDAFGWIYVEIDTSVCAEWKGNITGIRLDPFSAAGVFKFGSINFDVALYGADVEIADIAEVEPPVKTPAPIFDFGVINNLLYGWYGLRK